MWRKNIKVTAVITTHNRPDYLQLSLRSVLSQTTLVWQIIIVNDGSDSKLLVAYEDVLRLFETYAIIEHIKLPNKKGANYARNIGVKLATGDIIAFLDDDDLWFDHYIASQLQNLNKHPQASAQVCGYKIMNTNELKINKESEMSESTLRKGNRYCGMSGVMAKREALLKYPFDESLQNGQDWDLFVSMIKNGELITNIAVPLFSYRKNTPEGIGAITKRMSVDDSHLRLASAFKHRQWLGECFFRRRVAEELLTFLPQKPQKFRWLAKSLRIAGIRITLSVLFKKLIR